MIAATDANSSLAKQQVYSQYARGEISIGEVSDAVAAIRPKQRPSVARTIASLAVVLLGAFLLPTWSRKKD
jgi:hypothetical protein